ncbi:MAG TPA: histidine kinase [Flavisolibacter sp.]|nr:histidine kinase [Flavisolibacter sp.]
MPTSVLKTTRFRTAFGIWCSSWTALHFYILTKIGLSYHVALYDSVVSNLLLAGATIVVAVSLQFYLPESNKYSYLLGLCVVLSIIWVSISGALLLFLLHDATAYGAFFSHSILVRGAMGFLTISCMALLNVLWYTLQDQKETDKRKTEAERLSKEAELNNLRQQLQPHFLFNSLNSINALIVQQPQKARAMIEQLSDFLRGTLKEQKEWIPLEEELQHLELYLAIEKVRFGHRLSTSILNEAPNAQLPLMLLQPIVENAIKFGLYDTTDDITIVIEAKRKENNLILHITNPFDPETSVPNRGTGFGLSSVQRRLYLLFARQDLLQTSINNNLFTTIIKIPQP